jgi:hypothetical protein
MGVVTDGLRLWLDAADTSTIVEDASGFVEQWQDKSGNDFDAFQATAAERPILHTSALNDRPAVRFDGINDGMAIDDALREAGDYTVFIVDQYYGLQQGRTLQSRDSNWLIGRWAGHVRHYVDGNTDWVASDNPVPALSGLATDTTTAEES